jgi:peroxiredoxin
MDILLFAARLLLAGVLGVAGIAKLADLAGSRAALVSFGVPAGWAAPLGNLLPIAELVVTVMLLWTPAAWWGAVAALALLAVFTAGIGVNLARGRTPDCHCFGQLHSEPIGRGTLIRNCALALVAAGLVWAGPARVTAGGLPSLAGASMATWLALAVGLIALAIAAGEGWLLAHLLQQNGRLLLRIEDLETRLGDGSAPPASRQIAAGLPVGSPAPRFSLAGLYGETLTLDALLAAQKPLLLVFVDANCGPCQALLPEMAAWQRDHAATLTVVPITRGKAGKTAYPGLQTVLVQKDGEISQAYQVAGTPSAVLVQPDGTVGSSLAAGADAIRRLVRSAAGLPDPALPAALAVNGRGQPNLRGHEDCNCGQNGAHGSAAAVALPGVARRGDPAPVFHLPDLDGAPVELSSFAGWPTILVFWDPGCGYCRRMLDDLKAWEANPPAGAPKLLLVSTGTPEANRAQGLRAPILLDPDFSVGQRYGVRGTPSAVLVDADGRIASDVAVGADAVLALARRAPTSVPDAAS